MDLDKKLIGNRIVSERKKIGLTQEELATKLGLKNKSSICQYENGDAIPGDDIKMQMSKIFDCSIDYLLGKTDIKNYDKDEQEFRFAYHKETEGLTDEEISDALRFYKEMKKRVEGDKK